MGIYFAVVTVGVTIYMKDVVVDRKKQQMTDPNTKDEKVNTKFVLKQAAHLLKDEPLVTLAIIGSTI